MAHLRCVRVVVLFTGTDAVSSADTALVKRFIAGGIPQKYARIAATIMEKEGAALLSPKVQLHHHSRHAVWCVRARVCCVYCVVCWTAPYPRTRP